MAARAKREVSLMVRLGKTTLRAHRISVLSPGADPRLHQLHPRDEQPLLDQPSRRPAIPRVLRTAARPGLVPAMVALLFGSLLTLLGGCGSTYYLMPTPTVYAREGADPFADVPPEFRSAEASVLYITDRAPVDAASDIRRYGHARSRSKAFGETVVRFGRDLSWDALVAASRAENRRPRIPLDVVATREIARFGRMPPRLALTDEQLAAGAAPPHGPEHFEAERRFRDELRARLALTPRKEVLIYVHGFNNTFENAVMTTAELWHFLGREGVPLCYTWPTGIGLLRAYDYSVTSTDFTIHHFKQTLRLIASCPEVEKVHIIAHSRGTAVAMDALRELHLEIRGAADTRETLKLGTMVLAAADVDLDVVIARDATERIGRAIEQSVFYVTDRDRALGFSAWLFRGLRLGSVSFDMFDPEEIAALRGSRRTQFIDARVRRLGRAGHSYFLASPAISSDIVLLLRYRLPPGGEGRPLRVSEAGLWEIQDGYPGKEWSLPVRFGSN